MALQVSTEQHTFITSEDTKKKGTIEDLKNFSLKILPELKLIKFCKFSVIL